MSKIKYTDEEFIEAVKNSLSYAEVMRKLNLHVGGSNYDTIKRKIKELNLDISHMTGAAWNQGENYRPVIKSKPLEEILIENSTYVSTYKLKNRLIKEGYKEAKCECCGLSEWQGKPIALELHHINGIKSDLRIENLQILCPNCHAFTDNYRGKKLKNSEEFKTKLEEINRIVEEKKLLEKEQYLKEKELKEKERKNKKKEKEKIIKEIRYCSVCGKELTTKQTKYCSQKCAHEAMSLKPKNPEELKEKFKELRYYTKVGKCYNVSDNAVRKWIKSFGIENEIEEIINNFKK